MSILPEATPRFDPLGVRGRLADWSVGNRVQRFLAVAVPCGLFFGCLTALSRESFVRGALSGAVFGVIMGLIAVAASGRHLAHLAGLTKEQARQVARAVRNGADVGVPALAATTIIHADHVRAAADKPRATENASTALLGLIALLLLIAAATRRPGAIVSGVLLAALVVYQRRTGSRRRALTILNAERAAALARQLQSPS